MAGSGWTPLPPFLSPLPLFLSSLPLFLPPPIYWIPEKRARDQNLMPGLDDGPPTRQSVKSRGESQTRNQETWNEERERERERKYQDGADGEQTSNRIGEQKAIDILCPSTPRTFLLFWTLFLFFSILSFNPVAPLSLSLPCIKKV